MSHVEPTLERAKAVALISIGAATSIPDTITAYVNHAREKEHDLTIIPLDTLEGINSILLRNESDVAAKLFIANKTEQVRALCHQLGPQVQCQPYSAFMNAERLTFYDELLRNTVSTNASFRRAIINQTYRNLHPVLKRNGIDKRDPRLVGLTEFLLREISLKCYLGNEQIASYEYGHVPLMPVLADIYQKRYPVLQPIVLHTLIYAEVCL
jgi:hypothetical protein